MPKAEKGTPKYLANKMKAKGLQRLRWYCQMCLKQCRDDNGFKCHLMSEGHQRQMILFSEHSGAYIDKFSKEFFSEFMKVLSRRFGTKRVKANKVYQEYISFKEHLHMNSTRWHTLTEFCKYLGREGYAKVEEAEQGLYIEYIDRSPRTMERQRELEKKKRMNSNDEELSQKFIQTQMEIANFKAKSLDDSSFSSTVQEFKKKDELEKIKLTISVKPKVTTTTNDPSFLEETSELVSKKKNTKSSDPLILMKNIEIKKKLQKKNENWVYEGIVVKVIHKLLNDGKYYNKKGLVIKVEERFTAQIRMSDSGDIIKLDQEDIETVIPKIGGKESEVMIVNTGYCGEIGTLMAIYQTKFTATIKIDKGIYVKTQLELPYEDFSKFEGSNSLK